jgi:hypothetical protein
MHRDLQLLPLKTHSVRCSKYSSSGELKWGQQIATPEYEDIAGIAVDSANDIYVTGTTTGSLSGAGIGEYDAFVIKTDASGNPVWSHQLGTSDDDEGVAVAVDSLGGIFITGTTQGSLAGANIGGHDVFLAKYSNSGDLIWTRQFGSSNVDIPQDLSVDSVGNTYIVGTTFGDFATSNSGFWDCFVTKIDSDGNLIWKQQFGSTGSEIGKSLSVDSDGDLFIAGHTDGSLAAPNLGGNDSFLMKIDSVGVVQWVRQFGTSSDERIGDIATDANGGLYAVGTMSDNGTVSSVNGISANLSRFSSAGDPLWSLKLADGSSGNSIVRNSDGEIYVAGETYRSLAAPNLGLDDMYLMKLAVPEPQSITLACICLIASSSRCIRARKSR